MSKKNLRLSLRPKPKNLGFQPLFGVSFPTRPSFSPKKHADYYESACYIFGFQVVHVLFGYGDADAPTRW